MNLPAPWRPGGSPEQDWFQAVVVIYGESVA
jgi:hypothetical protein